MNNVYMYTCLYIYIYICVVLSQYLPMNTDYFHETGDFTHPQVLPSGEFYPSSENAFGIRNIGFFLLEYSWT